MQVDNLHLRVSVGYPATMVWEHTYDPLGSPGLSTLVAAVPLVVLLGLVASPAFADPPRPTEYRS